MIDISERFAAPIRRRTLVSAVWVTPVVTLAAAAPGVAASAPADLAMAVSSASTSYVKGVPTEVTYSISNVGGAATTGLVTVHITVPSTGTFTLALPAGWSIDAAASTTTDTVITTTDPIAAGALVTVTGTYTNTTSAASESTTFTGTIADGSGGESNNANNADSLKLTKAVPDLAVVVTAPGTTYQYNTPIQITYTITNVGQAATNGTEILVSVSKPSTGTLTMDTVPSGWTLKAENSSAFVYSTFKAVTVGENDVFIATYTNTTTLTGESTSFSGRIKTGSGGDINPATDFSLISLLKYTP